MDDNFGQPSIPLPKVSQEDESGDTSGEDDEGPDWTKLKSFVLSSRPSLPKRGDKEFEPAINGATNLQTHSLNRARDAMFGALDAERGISNKSVSYAVWYTDLARAHVTQARGVLFNGIGHSVPRTASKSSRVDGNVSKTQRRTELLPEETLYLIERGSLFCWKDEPSARPHGNGEMEDKAFKEHDMRGSPMSAQQAFAEMIGRDDLTLEHYHAYAYLKRLGFNVIRAKPPSCFYPVPASPVLSSPSQSGLLTRIFNPFMKIFSRMRSWVLGNFDWWRPLNLGWLSCARSYSSVFRALRIIPSGHTIPLHCSHLSLKVPAPDAASSELPMPYEIFYHVYKPNTPFRKSVPPPPDYSLVVVNARTTPLPTIHELTYLWSFLPESGPPIPRVRNPKALSKPQPARPDHSASPPPSVLSRLFPWLFGRNTAKGREGGAPVRKPHPFAVLKGGKKTIVIGVVDSGTVGFFRFSMGAFEEMPIT